MSLHPHAELKQPIGLLAALTKANYPEQQGWVYSFTPSDGTEYVVPQYAAEFRFPLSADDAWGPIPRAHGAYDHLGNNPLHRMQPIAFGFYLVVSDQLLMYSAIDECRAAFSRRGVLKIGMGGILRRTIFRPTSISFDIRPANVNHCPVKISGQALPYWESDEETVVAVTTSPQMVTNGGNATARRSVRLAVVPSAPTWQILNTTTNESITWGTAAASLVDIDVGRMSILYETAVPTYGDGWEYVTLGANQISPFSLTGGNNVITSYNLSSLSITFRDTWY